MKLPDKFKFKFKGNDNIIYTAIKAENVKKRITAITEEYNKFFKKSEQKENTSAPTTKKVDYSTISDDDWQESYIPHEVTEALRYTY